MMQRHGVIARSQANRHRKGIGRPCRQKVWKSGRISTERKFTNGAILLPSQSRHGRLHLEGEPANNDDFEFGALRNNNLPGCTPNDIFYNHNNMIMGIPLDLYSVKEETHTDDFSCEDQKDDIFSISTSVDTNNDISKMNTITNSPKTVILEAKECDRAQEDCLEGVVHEFDFCPPCRSLSVDLNVVASEHPNELRKLPCERDNEEEVKDSIHTSLSANRIGHKRPLLIRELPIANAEQPFGEYSQDDTTGLAIWCSSLIMTRWMTTFLSRLRGKTILELGSGCGVTGLATAHYSHASAVYLTDCNTDTLTNLKFNISLNNRAYLDGPAPLRWGDRVHALSIDWSDPYTWPTEKMDFIVGSDLVYQPSMVRNLKKVILGLLNHDGTFLYAAPIDCRHGLMDFVSEMKQHEEFSCVKEEIAPDSYMSNPLQSGNKEECALYFDELQSMRYMLYEFRRCKL